LLCGVAHVTVIPALLLFGSVNTAEAGLITLSFSGTVATGYDSSNIFGGGNLTGNPFSATITFDPSAIGRSSCGSSTNTTSCNWSVSGGTSFTQMLTMSAQGRSYTQDFTGAKTSSLSLNSSGNDAIYLSFGGNGFSFSLNAVDLGQNDFFANQFNVNDLNLDFTDIALNPNSSAEYGNWNATSFTLKFDRISASSGSQSGDSTPPASGRIPEPSTLAVLAAALLGLSTVGRRERRRT
jgi:hypothetical protein